MELLKDFRPNGHAYFFDPATDQIAIADCSGYRPADTDDGVLYVDFGQPIRFGPSGSSIRIPLEGSATTGGIEETAWLILEYGMEALPYGDDADE